MRAALQGLIIVIAASVLYIFPLLGAIAALAFVVRELREFPPVGNISNDFKDL